MCLIFYVFIFAAFFLVQSFVFVNVGGTDLLVCKPITESGSSLGGSKIIASTVVLGCDCCVSDTDESHSALDAADFGVERFDITPEGFGPSV